MPYQAAVEILETNLQQHPAVKAWRGLQPGQADPQRIEILKKQRKSAVYRLEGVGLGGAAVIAKRCSKKTGLVERTIYREVLAHLPVASLHYYGFSDDDDDSCWLFLEDAGKERFSPLVEEQRTLAARWLGTVHTSAARIASASTLPDGGPSRYLDHLRSARHTILRDRSNPVLRPIDVAVLEDICGQFDFLENRWNRVEQWCKGMPLTLVHGDFRPKNLYVRTDDSGTSFFLVDWETAGWGVQAVDLAPVHRAPPAPIDIAVYWSVVHETWPFLDIATLERLVNIGRIFRQLSAISWASKSLAFDTFRFLWWAVDSMKIYKEELADAIQTGRWD